MINREATIRWKGYDPNDLKSNSSKRVWVNCDNCGNGRWVIFNQYRDLCFKCAMKMRRGIKRSQEVCEKISKSNMGHNVSDETKRKMSENHPDMSGENNPMFGKHHTEKTRTKIRVKIKQYYIDHPEAGSENSARQIQYGIDHPEKGEKHSKDIIQFYIDHPEVRKFHSERMKQYFSDPINRKMVSERMKQYYIDHPEVIMVISKERIEYWAKIPVEDRYWHGKDFSLKHRKNISDSKIEYFSNPANRKSLSDTVIIQMNRPGIRDKIKELHNHPDVVKNHSNALKEINSRPEIIAMHKSMVGSKNGNWKGGISFGKYCNKFNEEFKEKIRNQFNRLCFLCGNNEIENNNKKLSVHHVNYDKDCLCNGDCEFVPLCMKCHGKTNSKRQYWEDLIMCQLYPDRITMVDL